ncbi:ribonuclease H-like domain-containing protein [Schizophyllum commune]
MDRRPIGPGGGRYPPPEQAYRGRGRGHPNGDRAGPHGGYRNSSGDRGGSNFGRGGPPPASGSRGIGNGRERGSLNNGYDQSYQAAAGQRRNDTREANMQDDSRARKVSPIAPDEEFTVLTNHFEITKIPSKVFVPYEAFSPEVKQAGKRHALFHNLRNRIAEPEIFPEHGIYDGRNQFWTCVAIPLPDGRQQQWSVPLNGSTYNITVTLIEGAEVNTSVVQRLTQRGVSSTDGQTQSALRLLQLLVRQASMRFPNNKRAYFPRPIDVRARAEELRLSIGGIALRVGYFQSVRPTVGRLLVNVDQALAAFYASGPFLDVVHKVCGRSSVRAALSNLRRHFYKVKINVPLLARENGRKEHVRLVYDIIEDAGSFKFELNGEITTVEKYFLNHYNFRLKHPHEVGVVVSPKNSMMRCVIPGELCVVCEDQFYRRRLNDDMMSEVLKLAKKEPPQRKHYICRPDNPNRSVDLQTPLSSYADSPYIREAGMEIKKDMAEVRGKQLRPPYLAFNRGQVLPNNGSWNLNTQHAHSAMAITHFIGVNFARGVGGLADDEFGPIFDEMRRACHNIGMRVPSEEVQVHNGHMHDVESALKTAYEDVVRSVLRKVVEDDLQGPSNPSKPPRAPPNLPGESLEAYEHRCIQQFHRKLFDRVRATTVFLVLVPANCQEQYDAIKHFGDIYRGVTTQIICMTSVSKWYKPNLKRGMNDRFPKNVAIKINARLGGINWQPDVSMLKTFNVNGGPSMIMGADVGHPGPNQLRPSIATLVYSLDLRAMQYEAITTAQRPRLETLENLRPKTTYAIRKFLMRNNQAAVEGGADAVQHVPSSIVFFRDGLSEGQNTLTIPAAGIDDAWQQITLPTAFKDAPKETLTSRQIPRPPLTYIVVSKRHHVRFFATDPRQTHMNGNLHAGFVTTGGIDSPYSYDFYLQSQHAIQGTARPAHYIMLKDAILDNQQLQAQHATRLDQIARLSFYLCHAYSKATSSVSIPAPVYYADIACRRGNIHLEKSLRYGEDGGSDSGSTLSEDEIEKRIQKWCTNFQKIFSGHSPMYFI